MAGPVKGAGRITRLALLTAIALTIFMAEAQLPVLPIPGVKLGLANIVTVYAMFALGPRDALLVLSSRVFLGAVFSGQMMTLFYSGAGGLLSWSMLALLRRPLGRERIWLASPGSALFHNLGQLLAAAGIARSWAVLAYLPYLVLAGCAAGLFTGVGAQAVGGRLGRLDWRRACSSFVHKLYRTSLVERWIMCYNVDICRKFIQGGILYVIF